MAIEQEWWKNKLAEDIYATLRHKEQTLAAFQGQSPQLWLRRHLVDWLSIIVDELGICSTAQHLAVYLLDRFMDGLEVEMSFLPLLALTCLLLAVKFEEHSDRVPLYRRLNSYLRINQCNDGRPYTAKQFLNMELNVLKFSKFELCLPTVAHFLPYFLKVAVDDDDLRDGIPIITKLNVESYLEKHAFYFQEIVLQDVMYRDYAPSLVAAACVAAARICLRLTPTWPKQMELMTDYYREQLLPCLHSMLGTHQQDSIMLAMSEPFPHSPLSTMANHGSGINHESSSLPTVVNNGCGEPHIGEGGAAQSSMIASYRPQAAKITNDLPYGTFDTSINNNYLPSASSTHDRDHPSSFVHNGINGSQNLDSLGHNGFRGSQNHGSLVHRNVLQTIGNGNQNTFLPVEQTFEIIDEVSRQRDTIHESDMGNISNNAPQQMSQRIRGS